MLFMSLLLPENAAAEEGSLPASVNVLMSLVAETGIAGAIDTDGIVVIEVKINRIKDTFNGQTADIPGGIASYTALVTTDPAGGIDVLGVRGAPPFDNPVYSPSTGVLSAVSTSPQQPDNTTVVKLVIRIVGNALTPYDLNVEFQEIIAYDSPYINVPGEVPDSLTFRRGDTTDDGVVNIFDAMFIAQYIVGQRSVGEIRPLNAASVNFGGSNGDELNIFDAMFVAQYIVGTRNDYFE
jgi:hypothetical protein